MATLEQLPVLVVLERIPVPVLAIGPDDSILFANSAFAAMLGLAPEALASMNLRDVLHTLQPDESAVSYVHAFAEMVVEMAHGDGSIVRARMSRSALLRGDDSVALATFQDLTELLWEDDA
jgi:PAS domain S-box-containing protein